MEEGLAQAGGGAWGQAPSGDTVDLILEELETWAADVDEQTFLQWAQESGIGNQAASALASDAVGPLAAGGAAPPPVPQTPPLSGFAPPPPPAPAFAAAATITAAAAGGMPFPMMALPVMLPQGPAGQVPPGTAAMLRLQGILTGRTPAPPISGATAGPSAPDPAPPHIGAAVVAAGAVAASHAGVPPREHELQYAPEDLQHPQRDRRDQIIDWMRTQREHWLTTPSSGGGDGSGSDGTAQQQQGGEEPARPKQQRVRGLTEEERIARRKRSLAESNKRYQAKRKGQMDALQQQLNDRQQDLDHLIHQNTALRAKMKSLRALIADREMELAGSLEALNLKLKGGPPAAGQGPMGGRQVPPPAAAPAFGAAVAGPSPAAASFGAAAASFGPAGPGPAAAGFSAAAAAFGPGGPVPVPVGAGGPGTAGPSVGAQALAQGILSAAAAGGSVPPEVTHYAQLVLEAPLTSYLDLSMQECVKRFARLHTAFIEAIKTILARADPGSLNPPQPGFGPPAAAAAAAPPPVPGQTGMGGPPGGYTAAATAGGDAASAAHNLLIVTVRCMMATMRVMSSIMGPRWWQLTSYRLDTGEFQPPPPEHWVKMVSQRSANAARLQVPVALDQEFFAILMLFAESMHKLLQRRVQLMQRLVSALSALGDSPAALHLTQDALNAATPSLHAREPSPQSAPTAPASDVSDARREGSEPGPSRNPSVAPTSARGAAPGETAAAVAASAAAAAAAAAADEEPEGPVLGDMLLDAQETLEAINANIQQQANLLAMLHGSSALLSVRTPLLMAHSMVASYPYIPDMLKASQVAARIYLPPIFHLSGVGLSAEEVDRGADAFEKLLMQRAAAAAAQLTQRQL